MQGTRFTTAASMAPLPELERMSTSLAVWKAYFSPSWTSVIVAAELGRAMMADLPGHGQQGSLRDFDGAGGEEAFSGHGGEQGAGSGEQGAGSRNTEI